MNFEKSVRKNLERLKINLKRKLIQHVPRTGKLKLLGEPFKVLSLPVRGTYVK